MLHAKDLMIGDWVGIYTFPNENPQPKDLFPARISTIMTPIMGENGGEYIECQFNTEGSGIGCASRPVETCFPIPLTPEILEKNGFEEEQLPIGIRKMIWESEDTRTEIVLYMDDTMPMEIRKNIYYEDEICYTLPFVWAVHQLQHALRLCGIEKEIEL